MPIAVAVVRKVLNTGNDMPYISDFYLMQHCGVCYIGVFRWANFLPVKPYLMSKTFSFRNPYKWRK